MIRLSRRYRGRTTLVFMGVLILAGEIAAGFLIDYAPLKIRFPQAAKIIDSARELRSAKSILFFGSSRTGNFISGETVTRVLRESTAGDGPAVFNAAVGAGDPVAMDFVSDKLLEVGVRPSMAIIEVLPEVLARHNLWLRFHLGRQFSWLEAWHALPDAYLAGALSLVIATRLNAVYTFRSEFQEWLIEALRLPFEPASLRDVIDRARKIASRVEPADVEVLQKGAALARKNVRGYEIGGLNARALVRMIERYATLGTTIILIAPPVSGPYRSAYPASINATYLNYMRQLGKTYGTRFFDYRERLPDDLFYTPYYTTAAGRLYFSELLSRELLVPLITDASPELKKVSAILIRRDGR